MSRRRPTFALLGAAGYIAERHLDVIQSCGGRLLAACDPHDNVGRLDRYGEPVRYFPRIEQFDRWLDRQNRTVDPVDYVVVATPNHLHDAHCRLALRSGSDVICEKPVVMRERNLDALLEVERESGRRVWCVLQLRCAPSVLGVRERCAVGRHEVSVRYAAPRGPWYDHSWKGHPQHSGGVVTNIGVHLFDLVLWLFGGSEGFEMEEATERSARGVVSCERARVSWSLSCESGVEARREFVIDGESLDLTTGIAQLHGEVYADVLSGRGFGLEDARGAVALCERMRPWCRRREAVRDALVDQMVDLSLRGDGRGVPVGVIS